MHEVKDGARTLQFDGVLLGQSSSYRQGSTRWIEFELYKTENGSYVLSRVGVSLVFHSPTCYLVSKYDLQDAAIDELEQDALPCDQCQPTFDVPLVFPEKYRYWAQVSEDPQYVINALYKEDASGTRYLTSVARRLLDNAADNDPEIDSLYRIEHIP